MAKHMRCCRKAWQEKHRRRISAACFAIENLDSSHRDPPMPDDQMVTVLARRRCLSAHLSDRGRRGHQGGSTGQRRPAGVKIRLATAYHGERPSSLMLTRITQANE